MQKIPFGETKQGERANLYLLKNNKNTMVKVTDFGASLVSFLFRDRDGREKDVVLGYDGAGEYESHTCYFGAVVGQNCNRIEESRFVLHGVEWELTANENGNNLHSGVHGCSKCIWETKEYTENRITFCHRSREERPGFPGNLEIEVSYTLTEEDALEIAYHGRADADTVMNFTNHAYFNLGGHDSGSVLDHRLQIFADAYTPVRGGDSIPTGEIAPVEGTPMDFRTEKEIGREIEADFEQLKFTGGYDHNYVLSERPGEMKVMAKAYCEKTGIALEASTDCCGMQFYAGNFIGEQVGKNGAAYGDRCGFCLESQFYPNAVRQEGFASPVVKKGEVYQSKTVYRLYLEEGERDETDSGRG